LAHQGKNTKTYVFVDFFGPWRMAWDGPKWGREGILSANPDLADILGRMDMYFETFHILFVSILYQGALTKILLLRIQTAHRVNRAHWPSKENRSCFCQFLFFPVHGENGLGWPQMGPVGSLSGQSRPCRYFGRHEFRFG